MEKLLKNSLYSVLSWIIPILIMIITVPIFIKYLGNNQYGIYILLTNIMSFVSLLNFGTSDSVIKYVSELKEEKSGQLSDIINSSITINIITSLIIVFVIVIFKGFILKNFLKVSSNNPYYSYLLLIITITFIVNFISNNFISTFKGIQEFLIPTLVSTINTIIVNFFSIILLIKGIKLDGILLLNLICAIITLFIYYLACKKKFPLYKFKVKCEKNTFMRIFSFSKYTFLISIFGLIIFNSDKLFISYFFSASMVTFYSVPANLTMKVQQFLSAAVNSIFPKISSMYKDGRYKEIRYMYYKLIKIACLFLILILVPSIIYGDKLLKFWVGNSIAENSYISLVILFVAYAFSGLMSIPYYFFYGLGLPKYNMYLSGIGAFLNLILNIILIPKMGINGAAIATLVANLYCIYALNKVRKIVKLKFISVIKLIEKLVLILIPYIILCLLLKSFVINLMFLVFIYIIDFLIFFLLYIFLKIWDKDEIRYIKKFAIKNR